MKHWMVTAAAFALLTSMTAANAQNAPATNKSDTMAQPTASQSSQRMSTKHTSTKHATRSHKLRHRASMKPAYTTGASSRTGTVGGPRNDPSIHQSIGRDSRGTPKGTGSDQNK